MAPDTLGIPTAQDDQGESTDYLGQRVPTAFKSQPALPVGGPIVAGTGPTGVSASPTAPIGIAGPGAAAKPGATPQQLDALKLLSQGVKLTDLASKLFPGDEAAGRNPETEAAFQAQRAGERAVGEAPAVDLFEGGQDVPPVGGGVNPDAFAPEAIQGTTAAEQGAVTGLTGADALAGAGTLFNIAQDVTSKESDTLKAADTAVDVAALAGSLAFGPGVAAAAPLVKADIHRTLGDVEAGNTAKLAALDLNPAAIPFTFGADIISMLGGPDIFAGLFGGNEPSRFQKTRADAFGAAESGLEALGNVYSTAANTGDPGEALKALATGEAGGKVRTALYLPNELAQQLGLAGTTRGDQTAIEWSALNPDAFNKLMDLYEARPELINLIQGSGDVPYLDHGSAQQLADQAAGGGRSLMTFMVNQRAASRTLQQAAKDALAMFQDQQQAATPQTASAPPSAVTPGGGGATRAAEELLRACSGDRPRRLRIIGVGQVSVLLAASHLARRSALVDLRAVFIC